MTDRSRQPAVLLRNIERLEALFKAERERSDKAWEAYRGALYEKVDADLQIKKIREILEGDNND